MHQRQTLTLRCSAPAWHRPHQWTYGGTPYTCEGEAVPGSRDTPQQGRCCADPLCPCDYKPGWGPYAPQPFTPSRDLDDEEPA